MLREALHIDENYVHQYQVLAVTSELVYVVQKVSKYFVAIL